MLMIIRTLRTTTMKTPSLHRRGIALILAAVWWAIPSAVFAADLITASWDAVPLHTVVNWLPGDTRDATVTLKSLDGQTRDAYMVISGVVDGGLAPYVTITVRDGHGDTIAARRLSAADGSADPLGPLPSGASLTYTVRATFDPDAPDTAQGLGVRCDITLGVAEKSATVRDDDDDDRDDRDDRRGNRRRHARSTGVMVNPGLVDGITRSLVLGASTDEGATGDVAAVWPTAPASCRGSWPPIVWWGLLVGVLLTALAVSLRCHRHARTVHLGLLAIVLAAWIIGDACVRATWFVPVAAASVLAVTLVATIVCRRVVQ